jgi:hypothetical protein
VNPFEPKGVIPVVEACAALIRETPELDGFSYDVALTEVRARTERDDVPLSSVRAGLREATEALHAAGVPGVRNVGRGWQRMDPRGMVAWIAERDRRGRRQFRRAVKAVAAVDKGRLEFIDRHALDHHERVALAVSGIEQRRARRLRPLPPAEAG